MKRAVVREDMRVQFNVITNFVGKGIVFVKIVIIVALASDMIKSVNKTEINQLLRSKTVNKTKRLHVSRYTSERTT